MLKFLSGSVITLRTAACHHLCSSPRTRSDFPNLSALRLPVPVDDDTPDGASTLFANTASVRDIFLLTDCKCGLTADVFDLISRLQLGLLCALAYVKDTPIVLR